MCPFKNSNPNMKSSYVNLCIGFFFFMLLTGTTLAQNSTTYPYGGEPDKIRTKIRIRIDETLTVGPVLTLTPLNFHSRASFTFEKFNGKADFSGTKFDGLADFGSAQFHGQAKFAFAGFHSRANFQRAKFDSLVDFSAAQFDSLAKFPVGEIR